MKRRLTDAFREKIVFSEIHGKINIITFEDTAAAILHDSYVQSTEDDTDNTMQSLKHVAKAIRSEMLKARAFS